MADVDAALVQKVHDISQATARTGYPIITARRMISGAVLKQRNAEHWVMTRGSYGIHIGSSGVPWTEPSHEI